FLSAHNLVRVRHGAAPLTWSQQLVDAAQNCAQQCQFKHSGGAIESYGENLPAGTSSNYQLEDGIKQWADEESAY
ncbi:CAP domain-containing protein, partial [Pterulicium gracile]